MKDVIAVPASHAEVLYESVSYDLSKRLTLAYSSSFGLASRLFLRSIRPHIYALYGMVRAADEIVDTYAVTVADEGKGPEKIAHLLDRFEADVSDALRGGYSANPIVHAFVLTARRYGIDMDLVTPFFDSMRMDLSPTTYDDATYTRYIYGSAEVIGLMCLKIFVNGNATMYDDLRDGARALGSAYQKVNFLRDMKSDFDERGRTYFPDVAFSGFDDTQKDIIVADITGDFTAAKKAMDRLPRSSRTAVAVSYSYYDALLRKLARSPASVITTERIRILGLQKLAYFIRGAARATIGRTA